MKMPYAFIGLSIALALSGFRAEAASVTFQVVATFDYPGNPQGQPFGTLPLAINDNGVVVGDVYMSDFSHHGFLRKADGTFNGLIKEPNDHSNDTVLTGVNKSSVVSGYYKKDDGFFTSFLLDNGGYSEFAIDGATETYIFGLNNAGDFSGYSESSAGSSAFVDIAGAAASFKVPAPNDQGNFGRGINNLDQSVGYYSDLFNNNYGFLRRANGSFAFPFRVGSQAITMALTGINDRGWMVGNYTDRVGGHAVLFQAKGRFVTYDYPGATGTAFRGINKDGLICGYYGDSSGTHGLIVRLVVGGGD